MSSAWNVFRIAGDISHILSKAVLIWSIHSNRSAEGVSLITQALYVVVFCSRYLDLFVTSIFSEWAMFYLFAVKLFYIASSFYILFLMIVAYARTREREKAWKFGIYCFLGSFLLAAPVCKIFQNGPVIGKHSDGRPIELWHHDFGFQESFWVFSEILEAVAVLPQLVLLRQTTVPTVIDTYYLGLLGSYRALYVVNWIYRASVTTGRHFDPVSVIFGVIQTALYIDFAWVYYTRQRVKLRHGGIVDSDDLDRGWLVGRLIGKHRDLTDDEESLRNDEEHHQSQRGKGRWGPRGISVSADESIDATGADARPLTDPDAFEDLSDDEDAPPLAASAIADEGQSAWAEEADDEERPKK